MSYHVEFGQSLYEGFYQEIALIHVETGQPLPCAGIDHQFKVFGSAIDYGDWCSFGQIVASNSNGRIQQTTSSNVIAISVPPNGFFGPAPLFDAGLSPFVYPMDKSRSWPCALLAVPSDPSLAKVLLTGAISFGARTMNPRLTLKAYPLYPVPQVPSPSATQVKIQLATQPGDYDLVEAALPASPLDPARLTWSTGGPVTIGGPLSNIIAATKNWNATAMAIFLSAASAQPT